MQEDEIKELSFFEKLQAATALTKLALGIHDKTQVSATEQAMRWSKCTPCTKNKKGFDLLVMKEVDKCALCGCSLHRKIPLEFDPVESEKRGEKVRTHCPDGQW